MNYEQSMNNLHKLRENLTSLDPIYLEALDNGISALKTLSDMPAYWQVAMTLTEDELKSLMKTKLNSLYGTLVTNTYTDTDSITERKTTQ